MLLMKVYDNFNKDSSPLISRVTESLLAEGFSVIELSPASKKPARAWQQYQHTPATPDRIQTWFKNPYPNIGIVTGQVSRLIVIDCDSDQALENFSKQFPDLIDTLTVKTPRGWHLYYRTDHAPASASTPGVDLQSNGRYVVAPGSTVDGHTYQTINDQAPTWLTPDQVTSIVFWLTSQRPAPQADQADIKPGWMPTEARAYYTALLYQGRNNALFRTALKARDKGQPAGWTLKVLAHIHTQAAPPPGQDQESEQARRVEATRTIRSAYSRPARVDHVSYENQVPTAAKQKLNQLKLTAAWRSIQVLRAAGIRPGQKFYYSQALALSSGVVGDWSIRKMLDSQLFTPQTPRAAKAADSRLAVKQKNNAYFLEGKNQRKVSARPAHRPPILYKMPTNAQIMRILGLSGLVARVIDDVPTEALSGQNGAKMARIAMHRAYLVARPTYKGKQHSIKFLAYRLGVCLATVKSYNKQLGIPGIRQVTETPLHWHNFKQLDAYSDPDSGLSTRQGHYLIDETGKKYPPITAIAARLLKDRKRVSLVKQAPTFWDYSALVTGPDVCTETDPAGASGLSAGVILDSGQRPVYTWSDPETTIEKTLTGELYPSKATQAFLNTPAPAPARPRTYKRKLKDSRQEALAQRAYSQVSRLSLARARYIAANYPPHAIYYALEILTDREQKIYNPAGFFLTMVRAKANENEPRPIPTTTKRPVESHQEWLTKLRESPYAHVYETQDAKESEQ